MKNINRNWISLVETAESFNMEQKKSSSENNDRAPAPKLKIGRKVAPIANNYNHINDDTNNGGLGTKTYPGAPQSHGSKLHLPDLMKVSNIKVLNRSREEEITKFQTKCFFFLLGVALMAFGIGLTFYGVDADLRDFLILGPSFLIIGFILIVIGLVLICKDVYILNQAEQIRNDVKQQDDDGFNYYNMKPLNVQADNKRIDVYTVKSSRPRTVTSLRSDGVLTTSELLMEQKAAHGTPETPDPMVTTRHANEPHIKSVPHPTSSRPKSVQNSNNGITLGGSTITVKSSEDRDSKEDDTEIAHNRRNLTHRDSTDTVQMKMGDTSEGNSPRTVQAEASYCSPVRTAHPVVVSLENEVMTTEL